MVKEVLKDRYEIVDILGEGAMGRTMLGHDRHRQGREVAVKELLPSRMKRWKDYDLFGRESDTLQSLSHPGIPSYIDDFVIKSEVAGQADRLFLVQQFASGENLQEMLDADRFFSEAEVRSILRSTLEILDYLHHLNPPVIHRDIKPANIMMDDKGHVMLIDFGAVRESITADGLGSTIVGTFGYMPPEQYAGASLPATDIFALGASCVQLLCRRPPGELFDGLHEFRIPEDLPVSLGFERVLLRMTDPNLEGRYTSVRDVMSDLDSNFLMVPKEAVTGTLPIPYEISPPVRDFPGFQLRDAYTGSSHTGVIILSVIAVLLSTVFPIAALMVSNPVFAVPGILAFGVTLALVLKVSGKSRTEIRVFRNGTYTLGEVTGVFRSTASYSLGLTYRYELMDGSFENGCISTVDSAYAKLRSGDPVGVIYLPEETSEHVLYAVPAQYAAGQSRGDRMLESENYPAASSTASSDERSSS